MIRRYSLWLALILIPVTLLTMYARVMLDAHTISAVLSGALTGIIVTALFATKSRYMKDTSLRMVISNLSIWSELRRQPQSGRKSA
ncbi:membrane-associated phospholipid phosphatase [Sulfitobacter undariae]|uniref:Membrane-associated phospholipid phosphatase n=2 Tax=Sulfitobacter undariae TaxID=1563671 RepID=A0A7W6EE90_9RHOB|nr:membrane-associated phospholipid phosphatase [Sulfitobacter undariae]